MRGGASPFDELEEALAEEMDDHKPKGAGDQMDEEERDLCD